MKNKRRNGAQPEMKSLFKGYGDVAPSSKHRSPVRGSGGLFDGRRHCLLKTPQTPCKATWYLDVRHSVGTIP